MDKPMIIIFIALSTCGLIVSQPAIELHYPLREELEPRVIVGNIAQDANISSPSGTITYLFMGSVDNFELESLSGILSTKRKLDRESLCPFQTVCVQSLRAVATSPSILQAINISINIIDINDNSPSFEDTSVAIRISENLPANTTFSQKGATDPDRGPNNSVQSYEIIPDFKNIFALDVTPKLDGSSDLALRILTPLDREIKDYYQLFIVAKDGGNPPKTGMVMVNITVTDVNDNKPTFSHEQYDVIINENITVNQIFLTLSASDGDAGENGVVNYKLSSRQQDPSVSQLFGIRTVAGTMGNIGEIFVKRPLTVIPPAPYKVIIEASDRGQSQLSSQAIVSVTVLDVNNNDPDIEFNFVRGSDFAVVKENTENGTVIAFVHVNDADQGVNRIATCSVSHNYFRIEKFAENEFKIVVHGLLDREQIHEHVITVSCSDGGTPRRNATKSFIVQVEDENDNAPQFTRQLYKAKVTENKPNNTYITKVSATDEDQGSNQLVTYQLSNSVINDFYIEPNSGIIKSRISFDRENKTLYSFYVYAQDNGGSKTFTSTATVEIDIEDENDNAPQFSKYHYRFDYEENKIGYLGQVIADDPDALDNGVVTFRMKDRTSYFPFSLSIDGIITVTDELDREMMDLYTFDVLAIDLGINQKTSSAKVTVRVLDLNDNAPTFKFPNTTNNSVILEYLANPDTLVTTLYATDPDLGDNGSISYSIISGNEEELFYLDGQSGEIFLKRKLHIYEIRNYELTVAAQDQGNPQQSLHEILVVSVKFINVTTVAGIKDMGAGQNIIIAIVIGCVTALLSILIIITICVLRKMDSRKHVYSATSAEHMRIVDLKRGSSNRSSSSRGSQDRIMDCYELPRKEVSFSMDEDQENTLSVTFPSTVSNTSGLVTFKSNSSLNTQNGVVPNHGREDSFTDRQQQQQLNRIASLRVQQQYLQTQHSGKEKWKIAQQQQKSPSPVGNRLSGHEDSDMSAASTTDSGNGGSDEDIRHHPSESDGRPGSVSPRQHSTTDSAISRDFSASKPPVMSTFGYVPGGSGMSTFPRNPNGKVVNMHNVRNPHVHRQYEGTKLQRLHSDSIHPHQQYLDIPKVPQSARGSQGDLHHSDSNLQRANRNNNLTRSYEDTLDDSCVSPRDDDDRATTTSGSYTVNHEELVSEIDELFFKSRGDTVV